MVNFQYIQNVERVRDILIKLECVIGKNKFSYYLEIKNLIQSAEKEIALLKIEFDQNFIRTKQDIKMDPICKPVLLKFDQLKLLFSKAFLLNTHKNPSVNEDLMNFRSEFDPVEKQKKINRIKENNCRLILESTLKPEQSEEEEEFDNSYYDNYDKDDEPAPSRRTWFKR